MWKLGLILQAAFVRSLVEVCFSHSVEQTNANGVYRPPLAFAREAQNTELEEIDLALRAVVKDCAL